MRTMIVHTLLVAVGAALGGLTRWGVGAAFVHLLGVAFPWGTLFINVTGCLFLGWFGKRLTDRPPRGAEELRLLFAVGFCGAYTTFSAYELEACLMLRDGAGVLSAAYLAGSVALGLLAVRLGVWLAEKQKGVPQKLDDPDL